LMSTQSKKGKKAPLVGKQPRASRKSRLAVPRVTADKVKALFRHRCAVCAAPYMELHHIDEDPGNNDEKNLILLCSNCHHGRVHGQGHTLDQHALRLYRELGHRFAATGAYRILLARSSYVTSGAFRGEAWKKLVTAFDDLVSFVKGLKHGPHFATRVRRLLQPPQQHAIVNVTVIGSGQDVQAQRSQQEAAEEGRMHEETRKYKQQIEAAGPELVNLMDEILMAQDE
jgi:hypothetical protein